MDGKQATLICLDSCCKTPIFCDGCSSDHASAHSQTTTILSIQSILRKDAIQSWFDPSKFEPKIPETSLWAKHRDFCFYLMTMVNQVDAFIKDRLRKESKEFVLSEQSNAVKESFERFIEKDSQGDGGQGFVEYARQYHSLIQISKSKDLDSSDKTLKEIDVFYRSIKEQFDAILNKILSHKEQSLKPLSAMLQGHKYSHSGLDSSGLLLAPEQKSFISDKLFKGKATFELLFRGKENNFESSAFHESCDGKGPTLTLVRVNDKIFGGYTDVSWNSEGGYQQSNDSFLFSVTRRMRFQLKDPKKAVYHSQNYGPTFGGGHDLALLDNCGQNLSSWSSLNFSYAVPEDEQGEASKLLAGSSNFQVTDYEVYQTTLQGDGNNASK